VVSSPWTMVPRAALEWRDASFFSNFRVTGKKDWMRILKQHLLYLFIHIQVKRTSRVQSNASLINSMQRRSILMMTTTTMTHNAPNTHNDKENKRELHLFSSSHLSTAHHTLLFVINAACGLSVCFAWKGNAGTYTAAQLRRKYHSLAPQSLQLYPLPAFQP
jgi:hypothetical protein